MARKQLSQKTIDICKATAPIVAENGVAITATMYRHMLGDNPELRQVFNGANQSLGVEKTRASQTETFSHEMFNGPEQSGETASDPSAGDLWVYSQHRQP